MIKKSPTICVLPPPRPPGPGAERSGDASRPVGEQGVTLLEVMVALGIVAVVLVAVYRLQMQSIAMAQIARFHTQAPLLAQQLVAEIELQAPDYPSSDRGDFGEDYPGYTWSFEIRDTDAFTDTSGRALMKRIDLQIYLNSDEDLFALRTYRLVNLDS